MCPVADCAGRPPFPTAPSALLVTHCVCLRLSHCRCSPAICAPHSCRRGERGRGKSADRGMACPCSCPRPGLCRPHAAPAGGQAGSQPGRATAVHAVRCGHRIGSEWKDGLQDCSLKLAAWHRLQRLPAREACQLHCMPLPRLLAISIPATSSPLTALLPHAGGDPSVSLEQMCWLTTLCSHVLADAGDGETPLVPLPITQACETAAAAAAMPGSGGLQDPAERLSAGLLAVGCHCLQHAGQASASPRLAEVAAASLARWADTYLIPEDSAPPALAAAFGSGSAGGAQAAQMLVSLVLASLTSYPGEKALHEVSCTGCQRGMTGRGSTAQLRSVGAQCSGDLC